MSSENVMNSQEMSWVGSLPTANAEQPIETIDIPVTNAEQPAVSAKDVDSLAQESWLQRIKTIGVNAVKTAVVAAEVTPINEMVRTGILAALLTQTRDPAIAAAVAGGSTFVIEGGAALAVADWVANDHLGKIIDRIDQSMARYPHIQKVFTPKREVKVSGLAEVGLALMGGTVVTMEARQRENPTRSVEQVRKHGLFTAAWLSGALAVSGALTAEGIANPDSPWVWGTGAGLLGLVGIKAGYKKLKSKLSANKEDKL